MFRTLKCRPVLSLGGQALQEFDLCPRLSCSKTAGDCHVISRALVSHA